MVRISKANSNLISKLEVYKLHNAYFSALPLPLPLLCFPSLFHVAPINHEDFTERKFLSLYHHQMIKMCQLCRGCALQVFFAFAS